MNNKYKINNNFNNKNNSEKFKYLYGKDYITFDQLGGSSVHSSESSSSSSSSNSGIGNRSIAATPVI